MTLTAQSEADSAERCNGALTTELSIKRAPRRGGDEVAEKDKRWPGRIRRICHAKLKLWGLEVLADSMDLVVSELVTNALRYGVGEVGFRLVHSQTEIRIEVDDGSPDRPQVQKPGPNNESGRGLLLVSVVADDWGVSDDGTRTWCTLTVPLAGDKQ